MDTVSSLSSIWRFFWDLMSINQQSFKPVLKELPNLSIKNAGFTDTSRLFDLQKSYEIEEVILNPEKFNPKLCYEHLQATLTNEIVFFVCRTAAGI